MSVTEPPARPVEKFPTGIPGFDHVSGDGLPAGEATLVAGTTGTGKTVLAAQFLVAGITGFAQPGVFVAFEEPPDKIRRFMAGFGWDIGSWEADGTWAFVDATPTGEIEVVIGDDLDFGPLVARVGAAVEATGARRVVIDSLSAPLVRFGDLASVRAGLGRLVNGLDALGVTTVITVERPQDYNGVSRFGVEEFVVDNIVLLRYPLQAEHRRRTVEVLKFRGTPHRQGEYPFAIDGTGINVIPLSSIRLHQPSSPVRVSLGNPGIDEMCGGGPFRDSVILVSGATGTGKSLVAVGFLAAAGPDDRALLVAFEESPEQLTRNAGHFGYDLEGLQAAGRLRIMSAYPESGSLEQHLVAIKAAIDEYRPTRVALDSLSALERIACTRGTHEFIVGLTAYLKQEEITGLMTTTTTSLLGGTSATGVEASTLIDMIILLRYIEVYGELRRGVTVLKIRGSDHDKTIREFVIGPHGVAVGAPFRTTSGILAGATLQLAGDETARVGAMFPESPGPGAGG